jgi:serine/threonine-protein kinase
MAPEVIDGKSSDHRADLFSLGTLLYWLAVGELPFTAPHPSALFKRILEGEYTRADAVCPKVGRRTARLIDRCLATSPDDRPASAEALAADIRAELEYVELAPPGGVLRRFLADPEGERPNVERAIVGTLLVRAREALDERAWGRASDAVNRILAREPDHAEARAILERLARGERRTLVLRRGAAALIPAGLAAAVLALGIDRGEPEPSRGSRRALRRAQGERSAAQRGAPATDRAEAPPARAEAAPPPPAGAENPREDAPEAADESDADPTPTAALPPRRTPRPEPGPPNGSRRAAARRPAPADARAARPSSAEAPTAEQPPVEAELVIQIGRGYADVWVDDRLVLDLAFRGRVELSPGRHAIRVVRDREKILARLGLDEVPLDRPFPQFGRFEPRTIEVDEAGHIFELGPAGPVELKDGVLRFSIPTTPQQAERNAAWISS